MINFTKKELESILNWGNVYTEFGMSWTYKMHKPLMDKIEAMIENYCDNDWENPCCGCPNSACVCNKCGIKL